MTAKAPTTTDRQIVTSEFLVLTVCLPCSNLNQLQVIVVGSGEKANELALAALQVRQNAYSPYSKFQVGAALLCEDGTIVKGESTIPFGLHCN
jgi:hypothetical protein